MSDDLRVTVVMPAGILGGAERWLLTLLDATERLKLRVVLLAAGPLEAEFRRRGIPTEVMSVGREPHQLVGGLLRLAARLRREAPDIVVGNGIKAAIVAVVAGRVAGVPTAWVKHDHSFDGPLVAAVSRLADTVVATSTELATSTGRGDATVLEPVVGSVALSTDAARVRLAEAFPPGDGPVLGMASRLVPYKGIDDAIRALAHPGGKPWRLVVLGIDDPSTAGERERLDDLARRCRVADRVLIAQAVPDAAELMAAFDAVAVLTKPVGGERVGTEGFALTAAEAMAAGVPVVSTPPVHVRVGASGIAVPAGDPPALAGALAALGDPARRAVLGRAAAAHPMRDPDAASSAKSLVATLAEGARRPGAGQCPDGSAPGVSVVTTVRDEVGALDALLSRLAPQLVDPRDEVVVVDGGSEDGSVELIRHWCRTDDRLRLIEIPGAGISAGRNAGVRAAVNDVVACTDAGCEPAPNWIAAFRAAAAEPAIPGRAPVGLWTGPYRVAGREPMQAAMVAVGYPHPEELRRPTPLVRGYGRLLGRSFDPSLSTGRSVAFRRQAWCDAGGFPEHLSTAEDVSFGRSVVRAGHRALMVADAEVTWHQRATLRGTARMYFRYGQGSGRSRDRLLLGRDLLRAAVYLAAPVVVLAGERAGRASVVLGAAAYLSLPAVRTVVRQRSVTATMLLPLAAAIRDIAKAAGCVHALARRDGADPRPGP